MTKDSKKKKNTILNNQEKYNFVIKKKEKKEELYISRKIYLLRSPRFAEPAAGRLGQQYRLLGIETLREAR